MDRLRELLNGQYRQYRNRMNYLTWYFGWDNVLYHMPWMFGRGRR